MAWAFQSVLNAGLQILLSIFGGWLCGRLHLVDPDVLSASLNAFAMKACLPAFVIHLLGIKADLTDLAAWKALGAFVLWVSIIQLACLIWHKLHNSESMRELGMHCLLLTTNNTGFIGWPVLVATIGAKGASLSMLLSVLLFIQLLPAAVACFEYQKYIDMEESSHTQVQTSEAYKAPQLAAGTAADSKTAPLLQDQAASAFPHEYRYCYWTNENYVPNQIPLHTLSAPGVIDHGQQADSLAAGAEHQQLGLQLPVSQPLTAYTSTVTDSNRNTVKDAQTLSTTISSRSPGPRSPETAPVISNTAGPFTSGRNWWWWRGSSPAAAASLKRSKDSSSNLLVDVYSDSATPQGRPQQPPQNQGSVRMGKTTLTRRLSRGLGAKNFAAESPRGGAEAVPRTPRTVAAGLAVGSIPAAGANMPASVNSVPAAAVSHTTVGAVATGLPSAPAPRAVRGREGSPFEQLAGDSAVELSSMLEGNLAKQHQQSLQLGEHGSTHLDIIQQPGGVSCYVTGPNLTASTAGPDVAATKQVPGSAVMSTNSSNSSRQGLFGRFAAAHPLLVHVVSVQLQSPLMWLNFIAIAMSLSGLRVYLDPDSPHAIPALGFIDGVMSWFSGACIPVTLFANGVWMADKNVFGGKQGQIQVTQLLVLKLFVLPALMVAVTVACGLRDANGLGLVLLASCPLAQMAFLLCFQYKAGAELATSLTIQGVLLMLPHMIAVIKVCQLAKLYDVQD